jgi:hypothetical protein
VLPGDLRRLQSRDRGGVLACLRGIADLHRYSYLTSGLWYDSFHGSYTPHSCRDCCGGEDACNVPLTVVSSRTKLRQRTK